ncbi:type I secretion system permease/ATPase [Novosphingobium sp. M1R2S20]|uniref:Type I secretion system permease/ATPase n=1 Tax=Novosphingobium rhizovicinum TaxID=3228928 RepID=A0ABV3R6R8_9SPHN
MRQKTCLRQTLLRTRNALIMTAALTAVLNVLQLGGSLYMMMIYDSVLPSHSVPTLVGLLLMVAAIYAFQGMFDVLRSRMLSDIGAAFDARIASRVHDAAFQALSRNPQQAMVARSAVRDVDSIRAFLASPGPAAFMDLPWVLFFLLVLGLLHFWLALTTLVGGLIMVGLTYLAHVRSKQPSEDLARSSVERNALAEERWRHAELLRALGMEGRTLDRLLAANDAHLKAHDALARNSATLTGASRVFRMLLQSLVLTVGALLVIDGRATGGVIFASSVIAARALSPIDQIIASWRPFALARGSWTRLSSLLEQLPERARVETLIPQPHQSLTVEDVVIAPPGSHLATAHVTGMALRAGDVLGLVGPSGSGKTSVVRTLVGAWPATRGCVRFDGAAIDQYPAEVLGAAIGYLPQSVELLEGTIAQNISRFSTEHESGKIVAAGRAAGVHELIVSLPQGYDTPVGSDGAQLSAGQRQRIGLARALYGDPFFVALDEPNSNLDGEGEAALDRAIAGVRERGGIVVVIAHRPSALQQANLVAVMQAGRVTDYGPKADILKKLTGAPQPVSVEGRLANRAAGFNQAETGQQGAAAA